MPITSGDNAFMMGYNPYRMGEYLCGPNSSVFVLHAIDSHSTDHSSANSNAGFGSARSVKSQAPVTARMGRAAGALSGNYWAVTVGQSGPSGITEDPQSDASTQGGAIPAIARGAGGAVAIGSISGVNQSPSPVDMWCRVYAANQDWFSPDEWSATMADLANWQDGDVTAGVAWGARLLIYSHTSALPVMQVKGLRNTTVNQTVVIDATSAPGTNLSVDVNCGSGAGNPAISIHVNPANSPDYNETNRSILLSSPVFYKRNADGSPAAGIGIGYCALGGANLETALTAISGGAPSLTPTTPQARMIEWLNHVTVGKNIAIWIDATQNQTSAQIAELDAGVTTLTETMLIAYIEQWRTLAQLCGKEVRFLLLGRGDSAYGSINEDATCRAFYNVAVRTGETYYNLNKRIGELANTNPLAADTAGHWTAGGATSAYAGVWSWLYESYQLGVNGYGPKYRRMAR